MNTITVQHANIAAVAHAPQVAGFAETPTGPTTGVVC
jgi:hypothetical protein